MYEICVSDYNEVPDPTGLIISCGVVNMRKDIHDFQNQ